MKKVLFLLRSFGIGGAERQLIVLASGLQQSGFCVKIAVFYASGPLEEEARKMGVQIVDLKRKGRWDLLPFFFRLIDLIRREKPDVLHSYLQVPNIWAALVKLTIPWVKVVWGIRASNVDLKQYDWQWQLTDKVESLFAKIPNWIICNSQAGLRYHARRGYPERKMSVIHNGIDENHFISDRKLGRTLRKQWGIHDEQKLIGMVGRVDPIKDYSNFLHAAALVIQERPDARFVCVGGGPQDYMRKYSELAYSLNLERCLIWAGEQTEILNVYNALDLLASSSTSEGFSNVIGESMACGTPCVVTDVGDSAILIGATGEIVPPGNSEALKQGILTLLKRLEKDGEQLNHEARQRIVEQFSAAKLVSTTADTLKRICAVN